MVLSILGLMVQDNSGWHVEENSKHMDRCRSVELKLSWMVCGSKVSFRYWRGPGALMQTVEY